MDDRKAFAAIVYVLRTGIQWNALPRELGASSTVHDRFQESDASSNLAYLCGFCPLATFAVRYVLLCTSPIAVRLR